MGFLDFILGRTRRSTSVTQSAGVDGSNVQGGRVFSYELNPALQGRNLYITIGNVIANTVIVGTAVRYYQNLIGGTSWSVEPKEGTGAKGQQAADLVREGLFEANMPDQWSTCVKRASLFRMYGFSAHEWTMRRRQDGRMVFASVEHRPQSTVEYWDLPDGGGPIRGIVQVPPTAYAGTTYYYVPRSRLWYCVDNSLTDSPEGMGLLRHVVEHARRLGRYEQLEGFKYETDMRGIPVARVPYKELKKNNEAKLAAPIEEMVQKHIVNPWMGLALESEPHTFQGSNGLVATQVPKWAFELIKGDGSGMADVNVLIERINREIARCLGMEFLLLGGDGKGSLALSRDKTSMFASVLESALHELAWFTVHDLVYPLLALNGFDPEEFTPQVMPDPIATERIETTVDALQKLAMAGAVMMPGDPAIDQIRRRLHLAEQPKVDVELGRDLKTGNLPRQEPGAKPGEPAKPAPGKGDATSDPAATDGGKTPPKGEEPAKKPTAKSTFHQAVPIVEFTPDLTHEWAAAVDWDVVEEVRKMIRREKGGYSVYSSDGSKHLGGPYKTRAEAVARLRQVEHFKQD